MNTETQIRKHEQKQSTAVFLQHETEGDTSTHFIAGLVAAEFGVTLTANWLLSSSVNSTQASLGYIGVAVLAWGSISVLHSVPALLASDEAAEKECMTKRAQNDIKADVGHEKHRGQGTSLTIDPSEVAQADTPNLPSEVHAATSLPTDSFRTTPT